MSNTLYDKPNDIDRMTRRNHELCADLAEVRAEARELKGALQKSAERIQLIVKSYDEKVAEIHGMKEQLAAERRKHDEALLEHKRYYIAEIVQLRDELADANIVNDNRELRVELADANIVNENQELHIELGKVRDELADEKDIVQELRREVEWGRVYAQENGKEERRLRAELADANSALEKAVAELGILAPYVTAGLLPALDACGSVLLYGQQKYPANDWADLCPEEHNAAILRHIGSKAQYDHESEQLHAAHTAARALMALGTELPYAKD